MYHDKILAQDFPLDTRLYPKASREFAQTHDLDRRRRYKVKFVVHCQQTCGVYPHEVPVRWTGHGADLGAAGPIGVFVSVDGSRLYHISLYPNRRERTTWHATKCV